MQELEEALRPSQFSIPNKIKYEQIPKELIDIDWSDPEEEPPSELDTLMGDYLAEQNHERKRKIFKQFMECQESMFQRIRKEVVTK